MKLKPNDINITFKRRFYLKVVYHYINKLINVPFSNCEHARCSNELLAKGNKTIDIITIAFNNVHVLKHQMDLLERNILDKDISYVIADNSNNSDKANEIAELCKSRNLGYIRLPKNKWLDKRSGSYSHGAAANWLYYNYINKRKPYAFGFLDHDIYPLESLSLEAKIGEQGFYGYRRVKDNYWYIWPGLAFFIYERLSKVNVNFAPCMVDKRYLDTGSSLYPVFYSKFDEEKLNFASFNRFPLTDIGYENDSLVEFIDDKTWFHSANASYWREVNNYEDIIDDILQKLTK